MSEKKISIQNISTQSSKDMSLPPRWVMSHNLSLKPPRPVNKATIKKVFESDGMAWQFVRSAETHGLIVRIERGSYVAIDPGIAVRAAALDTYFRNILVIDNALNILKKSHAFLCLSAYEYTDYVPEKVMPVLRFGEQLSLLDTFEFDFKRCDSIKRSVLGQIVEIPILTEADTAILLLGTYLPREVAAGSSILENTQITNALVRRLKYLGYSDYGTASGVEKVKMTLPKWLAGTKKRYAENRMKLEAVGI